MMLSTLEIHDYLSAALDQEACKATLTAALLSRVESLRQRGIPPLTLILTLEHMAQDEHQINDDVILDVVDLLAEKNTL